MSPIARASLWTTLSFLVVVLVAAAIGVYAFGRYERAWGRGPSLEVITWVAIPVSVLVGLVSAVGFRVSKIELQRPSAIGVIVGIIGAAAVVVSEVLLSSSSELSGLPRTFALLVLVLVASILTPRMLSGESRVA